MNYRDNKGVTLISLGVTIIIILVITSAIIFNTKNQLMMREIQNITTDIELLDSKVDEYYLKYGELPKLCDYTSKTLANFKSKEDFSDSIRTRAEDRGAVPNYKRRRRLICKPK